MIEITAFCRIEAYGEGMKCPKCEQGTIKKICLKKDKKTAYFCEFCSVIWFEGEEINAYSGHPIEGYVQSEDLEYTFDEMDKKDTDRKDLPYSRYK